MIHLIISYIRKRKKEKTSIRNMVQLNLKAFNNHKFKNLSMFPSWKESLSVTSML